MNKTFVIGLILLMLGGAAKADDAKHGKETKLPSGAMCDPELCKTSCKLVAHKWKPYRDEQMGYEIQYPSDILSPVKNVVGYLPMTKKEFKGTKFIFREAIPQLGKVACRYGEMDEATTCTAEASEGIAIFKLPLPLNKICKADPDTETTSFLKRKGCYKNYSVENAGDDLYFIPLGPQTTLMIDRSFKYCTKLPHSLVEQMLGTLKLLSK